MTGSCSDVSSALHCEYTPADQASVEGTHEYLKTPFKHRCTDGDETKERCVRCLLDKHREKIEEIRVLVSDEEDHLDYDDLWLLRYVLSYGSVGKAANAAKNGMTWRRENAGLVTRARTGVIPPNDDFITKHLASCMHKQARDGSLLHITRMGVANPFKVTSTLPDGEILDWMMWRKEYCYYLCDTATRKTGLLTKSSNILDFRFTSLFTSRDAAIERIISQSGKISEHLYPQLVHQNILYNLPYFLNFFIGILKNFFPKKMADKVVCCPTHSDSPDIQTCEFVNTHFDLSNLPTFLGGTCDCVGGCVPGIPNDATAPLQ